MLNTDRVIHIYYPKDLHFTSQLLYFFFMIAVEI